MNAWIAQMDDLAGLWLAAMGRACGQGGAVLLLVWLVDRTFRRLPAQARVWLWRLAYLKLLLAFLWAAPIRLPLLAARSSPGPTPAPTAQATFARGSETLPVPAESAQTVHQVSATPAAPPARSRPLPSAATLLLAVWGLGVGWFGARLVGDLRRARRLRQTAQPALDERLAAVCSQWSARFGLRRAPDLRVSTAVATPLVLGVRRPLVLLPTALAAQASGEHLELMLAHELAHLKRRDLWWVWPAALGEALFFFHPAIWLAKRRWRLAQEIACDDTVVRTTRIAAVHYGAMLVEVTAKLRGKARSPILASLGAAETAHTLKRRLNAMKFIPTGSAKRQAIASAAILALAAPNLLPWRLVAQETKPAPSSPAAEAAAPAGSPQPDRGEAGQRPGGMAMRGRPADGGVTFTDRLKAIMKEASIKTPPAQVAPARFEATVFELRLPEDRVAELDARSLESKAGTAQSLAKALSEFGHTRVLYKVDQTVNLYSESIELLVSGPMESTHLDDSGHSYRTLATQNTGLIINISASDAPADSPQKGLDVQVLFHLSVLADSGVELAPKVNARSVRSMELSHSEVPRFGQPRVQLNVSGGSGGAGTLPTAYVVCYVFTETNP